MPAADFDRMSKGDLFDEIAQLRGRFVRDTHVAVDTINIAANFYLERARLALSAAGLDASSFLGHIPQTFESRDCSQFSDCPMIRD